MTRADPEGVGGKPAGGRRKVVTVAGTLAAIAALAAVVKNVDALSGPLAGAGLFLNERGTAALLRNAGYRDRTASRLLAEQHPDRIACLARAVPIDLDGNGVKSDLAIVFQRTERPGRCEALESAQDAAFFVSAWNGYRYVGDPELPSALTSWNFAGPAAFREAADSSYPSIQVFMVRDGRIAEVGSIDTVTPAEYTGTSYVPSKDGRSALVLTQASMSRVGFDAAGKPFVREVDGKALAAENQGAHLLSYTAEGKLSFDGDTNRVDVDHTGGASDPAQAAADMAAPKPGDRFVIAMAPGYRLYLVGCRPAQGMTQIEGDPGAFRLDLSQNPSADCPTGEESHFSVRVAAKGT